MDELQRQLRERDAEIRQLKEDQAQALEHLRRQGEEIARIRKLLEPWWLRMIRSMRRK